VRRGRRQNMRVSPSHKHMHAYQDFSGGINAVDADENISDSEMADLVNVDIGDRGSIKRRTGFEPYTEGLYWIRWSDMKGMKWSDLKDG